MAALKKHGLLKGEIRAIPLLNSMGFEYATREVPITNEDMNRVFPGDKNGTLAERIVYKIFKLITDSKPDLVLDLHLTFQDQNTPTGPVRVVT